MIVQFPSHPSEVEVRWEGNLLLFFAFRIFGRSPVFLHIRFGLYLSSVPCTLLDGGGDGAEFRTCILALVLPFPNA